MHTACATTLQCNPRSPRRHCLMRPARPRGPFQILHWARPCIVSSRHSACISDQKGEQGSGSGRRDHVSGLAFALLTRLHRAISIELDLWTPDLRGFSARPLCSTQPNSCDHAESHRRPLPCTVTTRATRLPPIDTVSCSRKSSARIHPHPPAPAVPDPHSCGHAPDASKSQKTHPVRPELTTSLLANYPNCIVVLCGSFPDVSEISLNTQHSLSENGPVQGRVGLAGWDQGPPVGGG
jgi:hypothetical protein